MQEDYKIYNACCFDVFRTLKDKSVDLVLCDPPYGMTAADWDNIIPIDKMWQEINRVLKKNGVACIFGRDPFLTKVRIANLRLYKYDYIWIKNKSTNFLNSKKSPLRKFENISVFAKSRLAYYPQYSIDPTKKTQSSSSKRRVIRKYNASIWGKHDASHVSKKKGAKSYPTDVLFFDVTTDNQRLHPTEKPVALLMHLIKQHSKKNAIVLDFAMGSGSCGEACAKTGRKFIGVEKNSEHYKKAEERIKKSFSEQPRRAIPLP